MSALNTTPTSALLSLLQAEKRLAWPSLPHVLFPLPCLFLSLRRVPSAFHMPASFPSLLQAFGMCDIT